MIEIIGEMGVNHNGSILTAFRLAEEIKKAGCTAVKTQLWNTERVYPRHLWSKMKKLELGREYMQMLKAYCDEQLEIELIVTPDEIDDAIFLKELGVKRIKTSSQDITNVPFLREIYNLGMPMIMSTGACSQDEMVAAIDGLPDAPYAILHCTSAYPALLGDMNLGVIRAIIDGTSSATKIGLSDHTSHWSESHAALIALGMGATIFEKHVTLNQDDIGPDHAASLNPGHLRAYVNDIQNAVLAMGDGIKRVLPCEVENRASYEQMKERKSHAHSSAL